MTDDQKKMVEEEMQFRVKIRKFYSTEKINRKEEFLKAKAERAK